MNARRATDTLWRHGLPALLGLLAALAIGLAPAPALAAPAPAPGWDTEEGDPPGRPADWDIVSEADSPPPGAAQSLDGAQLQPSDCLGSPARRVRYTGDGVIHLEGCGQTFRLSDVAAAGVGADKLQLVDPAAKIWLLKVKLKVEEGATLRVVGGAGGDASWLRLQSTPTSGVWLRAENGGLLLQSTKVTSWDPARNAPDTDPSVGPDGKGGRAYIAARSVLTKGRPTAAPTACSVAGGSREPYEARMDVVDLELGYLGYYAGESYGVAWKVYYKANPADPSDAPPPGRTLYAMADVFGNVSGSTFHHNYFGSYTFGGYCMRWTGNTFANNIQYGLDPHDDLDYLTIAGNTFRDNGGHGVICSVECDHLVIRGNQSYRNQHGIMLHRNVNGALVEGNVSRDNRGAGIAIFNSHGAIVRGNTVANNGELAIRLSVGASRNLVENNSLTGLSAGGAGPGYVIYTYKGSDPPTAGDGLPKSNVFRNNRLAGYKSPLMKIGEATGNLFERNTIAGPASAVVFSQAAGNVVRDSAIGQAFAIVLDSSSAVTLQDSRGALWLLSQGVPAATVGPSGSSLRLTAASFGARVTVTPIDLLLRPSGGAVVARPTAWAGATRAWSERARAAGVDVAHQVGGLKPGACYGVTANGASFARRAADASGRISFGYRVGTVPVAFSIARLAQCA